MHQTGHCANQGTYTHITHDYNLRPIKPVLDGEPLYEDHPNCFNAKELGHSIPEDIRRIMYWNIFAGAFGQTYGCHDVWQMYSLNKTPVKSTTTALAPSARFTYGESSKAPKEFNAFTSCLNQNPRSIYGEEFTAGG
jgi:hypothetical protein